MPIEVNKEDLIAAVKVLSLIPHQSGILSADFVRLLARSSHLEMALSSTVSGVVRVPWSGYKGDKEYFVARRLMFPFVSIGEGRKTDFQIGIENGVWNVSQGSRKAELMLRAEKVHGYTDWQEGKGKKETLISEELRGMLLASSFCATLDPSQPKYHCIWIGKNLVLASNGNMVFMGEPKDSKGLEIPFPVGIVPFLNEKLLRDITVDGDVVHLNCGMGYIKGTVSAEAKKKFPKDMLVKAIANAEKYPKVLSLPGKQLGDILQRLGDYVSGVGRVDVLLKVTATAERVLLTAHAPLLGRFEESIKVKADKELSMSWPWKEISPVLKYMAQKETVNVSVDEKNKSPYLLSGAGVKLLVGRVA